MSTSPTRRIAVITLPLAGHINPMRTVVDTLVAHGHEVTVIGPPGMGDLIDDVPFRAISDADYPAGRLTALLTLLPAIRGLRGIRKVIDEIAALSALYIRQLPSALEAIGADLVIHDQLEPAAGLVAQGVGLAQASLACALPMNRGDDIPPPYLGWKYRADTSSAAYGRWLNQGGYRVVDWLMSPQGDALIAGAEHFGLTLGDRPGKGCAVADWVSPDADISQCIPGLDYPRGDDVRPDDPTSIRLHEVGPLRGRNALSALDFERDGRDLVFCSLGTLMGGRVDIFERVARAAHALDVQLLIAHGGRLSERDRRSLESMPGRPVLRDFVDQASILSEARACVLHGGFNTVLDCLSNGVPMVLLPLAFEQRAIAARVARSGSGSVVRRASGLGATANIRRHLRAALSDRTIRMAALELAASSAQAGGVDEAVSRALFARPAKSGVTTSPLSEPPVRATSRKSTR